MLLGRTSTVQCTDEPCDGRKRTAPRSAVQRGQPLQRNRRWRGALADMANNFGDGTKGRVACKRQRIVQQGRDRVQLIAGGTQPSGVGSPRKSLGTGHQRPAQLLRKRLLVGGA